MAIAERRITDKRRQYEGERQAAALINWLNTTNDEAGKIRIVRVTSLFTQLAHHKIAHPPNTRKGDDGYYHETITPETERRERLQRELDTALRYYTMRPVIDFVLGREGDEPWTFVRWKPIPGSKLNRNVRRSLTPSNFWDSGSVSLPGVQIAETGAIKCALDLIESALIFKIKDCRCGKFFYKRFSHQRFCTGKCRLADFRNSDEARRKRNEYARKLYHLHKELDSGKTK